MILDIQPVYRRRMDGGSGTLGTTLSLRELEDQITELAGQLNAANYRWLLLIAEFDRRQGWADGKLPSCAHWLNFKVGLNLGAAREKVRVAHALPAVPKIAAAMARGELSYSKVRALTRVATPGDRGESLDDRSARYRLSRREHRALFPPCAGSGRTVRDAQQQATRTVNYWYDHDGSLVLKARLPALTGALLVKAVECGDARSAVDHGRRGPKRRISTHLSSPSCRCAGSGGGDLPAKRSILGEHR